MSDYQDKDSKPIHLRVLLGRFGAKSYVQLEDEIEKYCDELTTTRNRLVDSGALAEKFAQELRRVSEFVSVSDEESIIEVLKTPIDTALTTFLEPLGKVEEALRDAEMHIMSFYIDWSKQNEGPDHEPGYKAKFPPVVNQVKEALSIVRKLGEGK